jgi:hypothetical protein
MNEWLMLLSMLLGAGLFAAGGTDIPGIGGQKWIRRYILPLSLAGIALIYAPWWKCLGYAVTLSAFLHMGYGSKTGWLYRALIFIGYGLSALWLGFTWWVFIVPAMCSLLFLCSNWKATSSSFEWKICEAWFGMCIAVSFISALNK